jgi:hypothetical protein
MLAWDGFNGRGEAPLLLAGNGDGREAVRMSPVGGLDAGVEGMEDTKKCRVNGDFAGDFKETYLVLNELM